MQKVLHMTHPNWMNFSDFMNKNLWYDTKNGDVVIITKVEIFYS
jgi:hypothetical protein